MLKLMYITNVPEIASIADRAGLTEYLSTSSGTARKSARKNWDSVKSKHSISDISES